MLKLTPEDVKSSLYLVGGGDNCAILDFSQRHLTGHSWTYLRDFQKRRIFFLKNYPPAQQKPFFLNQRPSPLDLKNYFFLNCHKSFFYQSHCIALGLTIPKWYNTWVLKIFFVNIFLNFFSKIFKN